MHKLHLFKYLGNILILIGIIMWIPALAGWLLGDYSSGLLPGHTFWLPSLVSIILGLILNYKLPGHSLSTIDAMLLTVLSYFSLSIASAFPFVIGLKESWINGFFEAVSGITASGLTVFTGLDTMPKGILLWRSILQWLGGLGILTFFLAVSFRGSNVSFTLFGAEGNKLSSSRPVPGIFNTIIILWKIYLGFTLAAFLLFLIAGMSVFDAINHTLACVSTGGFSTHDASIGYFQKAGFGNYKWIEYITILFMLLGGINFLVHYQVFTGKIKTIFTDFEIKYFWKIIFLFTALIMIDHILHFQHSEGISLVTLEKIFRKSLFQVVALITSSGFSTQDINSSFFPSLSKQLFILLMIIGGCAGSTSGGFKVMRIAVFIKMVKNEIFRMIAPRSAVKHLIIRKQIISRNEVERIGTLFFLWIVLIFVGAGITAVFSDLSPWQSLSGSISALGTMGPHYFSVEELKQTHWIIKFTYSIYMIAGRIEILPVLILFSKAAWK